MDKLPASTVTLPALPDPRSANKGRVCARIPNGPPTTASPVTVIETFPPSPEPKVEAEIQAVTGDGGVKSRAHRFAVADAVGQSSVELGNIVARVGRNSLRYLAIFLWDWQLGQFPRIIPCSFHIQCLPLHRGA